jgi:uncharacterized phiE125 gp8 family phage protein
MSLVLVTASPVEPITVAQVKAQIPAIAGTTDFDALLGTYIAAVRDHLEGRDGGMGRAFVTQTWDLKLDGFDDDEIRVPLPPLQSITSVKYLDSNGTEQTMDPDDYQVTGIGSGWPSTIIPAYGDCWPVTYGIPECVTIRFVAGYDGNGASPPDLTANIPAGIKMAMTMLAADLFKFRETLTEKSLTEVPSYVAASRLLAKYNVHFFA